MSGVQNTLIDPNQCFQTPSFRALVPNTRDEDWYVRGYKWFTRKVEYQITEDYFFYVPFLDVTLLLPEGFIFDGASIPKFLWPIIAPVDVLLITAAFHDFAYKYRTYLTSDGALYLADKDKKVYDTIFKDISLYTNGLKFTSSMAYYAVCVWAFPLEAV